MSQPDTDTKRQIARANLGTRQPDGHADGVLGAFEDLSKNRLPLPQTVRIHNAKKAVKEAIAERDALKREIILQYDESGQGWKDPADAPEECVAKIGELFSEPVALDLGPPLVLNGEAANVDLSPQSFEILSALGFLVLHGEE